MKSSILLIWIIILFAACKKDKSTDKLLAATLILPAKDQIYTGGNSLPNSQTYTEFKWSTVKNAYTYDLIIKNLSTGLIITKTTGTNDNWIILPNKTSFSWYVIARTAQTETYSISDTWDFSLPQ
ncbi:hypothetical protein ACFS5N_11445 [Mucilaginibacter ximonensis]|uniref:SusE outer membrane protein domain-containing protein n=1 Tax=Mucilaginibacter ximonensis TaxID=538021 RepID=A0ABW5YCN5_9SPHI